MSDIPTPAPEALAPCPFCGEDKRVSPDGSVNSQAVYCHGCGALGPVRWGELDNKRASIAAWNMRALAQAPPALGEPDKLYEAIKHGDDRHRQWLHAALTAFATGAPIPEPDKPALLAAPHVSREAVAEIVALVGRWRARAKLHRTEPGFFPHGQSSAFNDCAVELEAALSAAFPGEFGKREGRDG